MENFVNFGNACRSTVRYIPIPAVLHALIRDETIIKLIFCSSFVSSLKNTQIHLVIFEMHFTEHGNSRHQYRLLSCSACTGPSFMLALYTRRASYLPLKKVCKMSFPFFKICWKYLFVDIFYPKTALRSIIGCNESYFWGNASKHKKNLTSSFPKWLNYRSWISSL